MGSILSPAAARFKACGAIKDYEVLQYVITLRPYQQQAVDAVYQLTCGITMTTRSS